MIFWIFVPVWNLTVQSSHHAFIWVETNQNAIIGLSDGEDVLASIEDSTAVGFVLTTVPVKEPVQRYLMAWAINDEGEYVEWPVRLLIEP